MIKRILLGTILLTIIFSACKQSSNQQPEKAYRIAGDTIYVADDNPLVKKLLIDTVVEESFSREILVAGTVQGIPTQLAYIAPPFAGRVTKSHIKIGQKVGVNTPLFEIISPDFTTAQKEFFQARSERDLARSDMRRKNDLVKNGVASQKEVEEAENALRIAEKEYENAYAAIKIFQTNPEAMILGQPLVVRSPISGDVIDNNVVTGLYINTDAEPVATVANLSKVWVVAQVKEKDIRFIHEDDEMDIHVLALPDHTIKGKVFHVDEAIDEDTRSIKILSECDNKDGLLLMGMYATVHFKDKATNHLFIPEKALLQDDKNTYVFVQIAPNQYRKTAVEAEVLKDGRAIVLKGLSRGQLVISQGGYYLK